MHRLVRAVIVVSLAFYVAGCGDSRGRGGGQPAKPAPFSVSMGTVADSFVSGGTVPLMRLTIRNTSTQSFNLSRMHCVLSCGNPDVRVRYDLHVNGRRVSNHAVPLAPGVPLDLYFTGETVLRDAAAEVLVVGSVTGMRNGDTLVLTEDFISTVTSGNDTAARSSNAVVYVDQSNNLVR